MQDKKAEFLKEAKKQDPDYLPPGSSKAALSKYEVKAGAVIPAIMISGINSDLPGQIIAQVSENVYDTATGQFVLIPQGSRLIGMYDSRIAMGQSRVLAAWTRIIFPNGYSVDLQGMPGTDQSGYGGFTDQVDNHYLKLIGGATLISLFSAGMQLSQPQQSATMGGVPSASQTLAGALGQQLGNVGTQFAQRQMNVQPTLTIRPGYQINVMVTKDMILKPQQ